MKQIKIYNKATSNLLIDLSPSPILPSQLQLTPIIISYNTKKKTHTTDFQAPNKTQASQTMKLCNRKVLKLRKKKHILLRNLGEQSISLKHRILLKRMNKFFHQWIHSCGVVDAFKQRTTSKFKQTKKTLIIKTSDIQKTICKSNMKNNKLEGGLAAFISRKTQ